MSVCVEPRDVVQHHLSGSPLQTLTVACEKTTAGDIARACITDRHEELRALASAGHDVSRIAGRLGIAVLDFAAPWRLQPVNIPKPWGQEIWYTGIEARGVSQVVSETGVTPLDWAIAIAPQAALGSHRAPNLLKILDPLPDAVFGDLYFELHAEKREVYVVTHVDPAAWPDGAGAIRYGFSAQKRAAYASDSAFVDAYRNAVHAYRTVRASLDQAMDTLRERDGFQRNEPVAAAQTRRWLAELPSALQAEEEVLRAAMDSFTGVKPLRTGDVLAVPLCTPHALQHGVRTVEFQTPVYERKILSFAQKVLTQEHWDTDEALAVCLLDAPEWPPFAVRTLAGSVRVERIVSFADFTVDRYHLPPQTRCTLPAGDYLLAMGVQGETDFQGTSLSPEQALLLPRNAAVRELNNPYGEAAVILVAQPTEDDCAASCPEAVAR